MIRKALLLIVIVALTVGFSAAGCKAAGSEKAAVETTAAAAVNAADVMVETAKYKKDGKVTVGFSWEGPRCDYSNALMYNAQYTLEEKYKDKVEKVIFAAADGDQNKQINMVEDMLTKKIDLLLYQPISESLGVATIEKAMSMNIPVIVFGASLLTEDYVSYVNNDLYDIGFKTTDWLCTQIGGKGKVIQLVGEPGSGYTEDYIKGSTAALKNFPDVELVNRIYTYYTADLSKQAMETVLNTTPDIAAIINQGGHSALGALEAFKDKNLPLPYTTVDDINLFMKYAKSLNYTKFAVYAGGSEVTADACEVGMKVLAGEPVKKLGLIPAKIYTADEINAMIPEGMADGYWAMNKIPQEFVKNYFK
jgi:ribose transport system substrate-binding protein